MRFVIAALAISPFVAAGVGMLSGRVKARPCCAVEPDQDARVRDLPAAGAQR